MKVKFQAWNPANKEMETSSFSGNYITFGGLIRNGSIQKDWILRQWTGLKDANGVEIYVGDILRFEAKINNGFVHNKEVTLLPVEFGKFYTGESILDEHVGFHIDGRSITYLVKSHGAVVVGNAYANPELLRSFHAA